MKKLSLTLAIAAITASIAVSAPVSAQAVAAQTVSTQTVAAQGAAPVMPAVGKMLYAAGGKKLAAVYKLAPNGAPQVLLDGRLITVPAATLSDVDGKVQTTLSMKDLLSAR